MAYQMFRGDPESKQLYTINQLIGGINTEFSDDNSNDVEFNNLINFEMDNRGSLNKRLGFGKLSAVSEIFNLFENLPDVKPKTPENPNPEILNDNIVYMKLLKNDNNVFKNLSAYSGEKAYREYQKIYGGQNNEFELLIITTNYNFNVSTAWFYNVKLPVLDYNVDGEIIDTITITENTFDLPVLFKWNKNLMNIDTIEFFDKIYFTENDKCLVVFDRNNNTFIYNGSGVEDETNNAYKPNAMEVRKIGFNLLGDDPLHWIDTQGISTDSIQGMYITTMDNIPVLDLPTGGKFRINVLYTGSDSGFTFELKEGEVNLTITATLNSGLSTSGSKVYDIEVNEVPTTEVEITIEKIGASIDKYIDYYTVDNVDPRAKAVEAINLGGFKLLEMYNRAVYYKDDIIYFSEINSFNYVPNYNYVSLPLEPTDKITKIIFFRNVYIIFTKYRIYKMIGQFGTTDFRVMPVNESVGCHAPNTVVPIENDLYFASPIGLYSLKSNEFVEGMQNLKELDSKVKSLTRDMSLFVRDLSEPAVRSVAISENAYAIRYKDKYMLYYNNAYEDMDLINNATEDVLVYKYEMKAFTQFRFPIKPTFMFIVENSIMTFATVPEKEIFTEEEIVFEYDFESGTDNNIVDKGDKGLDGTLVGGYLQPGRGVKLENYDSNLKLATLDKAFENNDFFIEIDTKFDSLGGFCSLFDLGKDTATGSEPNIGSLFTQWEQGYRAELYYVTTPRPSVGQSKVDYTIKLHRDSASRNASRSCFFAMVESGLYKIPYTETNFNFDTNKLETIVSTGSFVVNHDSNGGYSNPWTFSFNTEYPTYKTGYDKGPTQYFDVRQSASWNSGYGIRFIGRAEAFDGGAKVFLTPYVSLRNWGTLENQSRPLYTWIDGVQRNHNAPAINKLYNGNADYSCGETSLDINYTGQPSKSVDGQYNMKATISGVYRENLDVDSFDITMPYVVPYSITEWNNLDLRFTTTVVLNKLLAPSKRELYAAMTIGDNKLRIGANSEVESGYIDIPGVMDTNRHFWRIEYSFKTSNIGVTVYKDNILVGTGNLPKNSILATTRNSCLLGKSNSTYNTFNGEIYSFVIGQMSGEIKAMYLLTEGRGTVIKDSATSKTGVANNIEWIVENGLWLNSENSYVIIPELSNEYRFSNGFNITFEAKVDSIDQISKIIDLAMSYNTGEFNNQKCDINVGIDLVKNSMSFMSSSIDLKTYKIISNNLDLRNRHLWKLSLTDNEKGYTMTLSCDNIILASSDFNYGGITNTNRRSNFIGKSNKPTENNFRGMLYNIKLSINASAEPVPDYVTAIYEFDTSYDDFTRPIYFEIDGKNLNMKYPLHEKKLKAIFVKGLGGYSFINMLCHIKADGHLINNPYLYECYVDPITKEVMYEYVENRELIFNEKLSILGNMRTDYTKLGESTYEVRKLVVRGKGNNFGIKIQGESSDPLKIDSFGYIFKIGKVKER